jgi:hypothetical protein
MKVNGNYVEYYIVVLTIVMYWKSKRKVFNMPTDVGSELALQNCPLIIIQTLIQMSCCCRSIFLL